MTKEEITSAFKTLPQGEKRAVAEEIMREYCRTQGGSFAEMMSLCSGMMGAAFPFQFATSERTGGDT